MHLFGMKSPRARASHACGCCGYPIVSGQKYVSQKLRHDGKLQQVKAHRTCFSLVVSHIWEEGDDAYVKALTARRGIVLPMGKLNDEARLAKEVVQSLTGKTPAEPIEWDFAEGLLVRMGYPSEGRLLRAMRTLHANAPKSTTAPEAPVQ